MTEKKPPKKTVKKTDEEYTPMPTTNTKKRVQISVAVEAETAEKLDNIFFDARGKYRSRNDLVRHALEDFTNKHGMVGVEPANSSK